MPDPAVGHGERDDADVTVHNARSHAHKRSHTKGMHRAAGESVLVGRVPRRLAAAAAAVGPPPFCTVVAVAGLESTAPAGGANAWTARSNQAAGRGGQGRGGGSPPGHEEGWALATPLERHAVKGWCPTDGAPLLFPESSTPPSQPAR